MIRRLVFVFFFTGSGHLFSVFVLKWMARVAAQDQMATIGEFESLTQLILGLVGLGMQSAAIRNIALQEDWKEELAKAQTARLTLGTILISVSFFSLSNPIYLAFLMAPLLAASADYALYARGAAIAGAFIAFVRVVLPLLTATIAVYLWPEKIFETYALATVATYLLTNLAIASVLKVKVFYKLSFQSLKLYLQTIPLGIVNLGFYFMGLGLLLITPYFFNDRELVISFLALKFYAIFKGVIRVVQQAFVADLLDDEVGMNVDRIGIMIGLAMVGSALIYPDTFISLFFGKQYISFSTYFIIISVAALSFSLFNSLSTRLVLERKDKPFMWISIISVGMSMLTLIFLLKSKIRMEAVPISLLVGEICYSVLQVILFLKLRAVLDRFYILFTSSLTLAIPVLVRLFFGQSIYTYITGFAMMGLVLWFFFHKNLKLQVNSKSMA